MGRLDRASSSIAVSRQTKERLDKMKLINDETYNSLINRLADELIKLRKSSN